MSIETVRHAVPDIDDLRVRRSTAWTPRSWPRSQRRTEVSQLIGKARMASGGTRLVHSREMKVIERYSAARPRGQGPRDAAAAHGPRPPRPLSPRREATS